MTTVTLVGAGSVNFTRELLTDLALQEETRDCEIRLHDISAEALRAAGALADRVHDQVGSKGSISLTHDLRDAVRGADYVIVTIMVGGRAAAVRDFELTGKYGLRFTVGDTLGVAGIARALRTIPELLTIARACAEEATTGKLLNYTNPMSMLVAAVGRDVGYPTIGLCHSAENTADTLAQYLGVPDGELEWWSAGVNHMAWLLSLSWQGRDLYPELAVAASRPEVYDNDRVRFDLLKRVGYFVTESSKHVAEYLGFFIDKPAEIERLGIPVGEFLTRRPVGLDEQLKAALGIGNEEVVQSNEYAPRLIAALEGHEDWVFQGNVMNEGLVENLSSSMCVEVPCAVSKGRVLPTRVGALPLSVAGLTQQAVTVEELAVEAVLRHDQDLLYQAMMVDPQASAVLSVGEIGRLVADLVGDADGRSLFSSSRVWQFAGIPG